MSAASNFERSVKDAVEKSYKQSARDMQRTLDRLSRELEGQPLETAKSRVRREWSRLGGTISDPELTRYAQALIEGTRITVDVQPIRW